jgi:non-ribosomal peptide synthetase component E (peptide arylation enzyme)
MALAGGTCGFLLAGKAATAENHRRLLFQLSSAMLGMTKDFNFFDYRVCPSRSADICIFIQVTRYRMSMCSLIICR